MHYYCRIKKSLNCSHSWYTLNKKVEQKTKIGCFCCPLYKTTQGWFTNQIALIFQNSNLFGADGGHKYNIHLSNQALEPLTSGFLDLIPTLCSIMTGGFPCKTYMQAIKYIMITKLSKESILVFWWTISGSDKPYYQKRFLKNPYGFSINHP